MDIRQLTHKRAAGVEALATGVLNMDENSELQFFRWKTFSVFFKFGMAAEVSQYVLKVGKANMNIDAYRFSEGPTNQRRDDYNHVLFQVAYGFAKAFPTQQELIKVVLKRSTQLLNEECLRPMMILSPNQQAQIVQFCEACVSDEGDMKGLIAVACKSIEQHSTIFQLYTF